MSTPSRKTLLAIPLAGLLVTTVGACAHERYHRDLDTLHEEYHEQPHSRASHERFHDALEDLHRDHHDRDDYRNRYY